MRIFVRHTNVPISEALDAHVQRKLRGALRRFTDRVAAVAVRLVDENGPRGGVDTRCRVVVELTGGGQLVVEGLAADAYVAVTQAAARLHRQLGRALARDPRGGRRARPAARALGSDGPPRPTVSAADVELLRAFIDAAYGRDRTAVEALEAELHRAEVVPREALPPSVVRVGSQVVYVDDGTGERRAVTLVLPPDADAARGRVSVLAPIGAALIGLSVGDAIDWPLPNGRSRRLRVCAVTD